MWYYKSIQNVRRFIVCVFLFHELDARQYQVGLSSSSRDSQLEFAIRV